MITFFLRIAAADALEEILRATPRWEEEDKQEEEDKGEVKKEEEEDYFSVIRRNPLSFETFSLKAVLAEEEGLLATRCEDDTAAKSGDMI